MTVVLNDIQKTKLKEFIEDNKDKMSVALNVALDDVSKQLYNIALAYMPRQSFKYHMLENIDNIPRSTDILELSNKNNIIEIPMKRKKIDNKILKNISSDS
jgi:hypothetical protein